MGWKKYPSCEVAVSWGLNESSPPLALPSAADWLRSPGGTDKGGYKTLAARGPPASRSQRGHPDPPHIPALIPGLARILPRSLLPSLPPSLRARIQLHIFAQAGVEEEEAWK